MHGAFVYDNYSLLTVRCLYSVEVSNCPLYIPIMSRTIIQFSMGQPFPPLSTKLLIQNNVQCRLIKAMASDIGTITFSKKIKIAPILTCSWWSDALFMQSTVQPAFQPLLTDDCSKPHTVCSLKCSVNLSCSCSRDY